MPITAEYIREIINGRDFRPRLKIGERGQVGTRYFRVNTDDETEAVLAAGLPVFGEAWDNVRLPGCTVRDIGPAEIVAGGKTAGWEGWSIVPVQYSSAGYAGATPLPRDEADKWTEPQGGTRSVQVYYGVQDSPGWEQPINNGSGVAIDSGATEFVIKVHRPATANISSLLAKLIRLTTPNKVNDDTITVPPIYRTSNTLAFNAGELRFKSYNVANVNGLIQIACVLVAARDHKAYWTKTNDKGQAVAVVISEVYEPDDFSGIW